MGAVQQALDGNEEVVAAMSATVGGMGLQSAVSLTLVPSR